MDILYLGLSGRQTGSTSRIYTISFWVVNLSKILRAFYLAILRSHIHVLREQRNCGDISGGGGTSNLTPNIFWQTYFVSISCIAVCRLGLNITYFSCLVDWKVFWWESSRNPRVWYVYCLSLRFVGFVCVKDNSTVQHSLSFKDLPENLQESENLALSRFRSLISKHCRNSSFQTKYANFMTEYHDLLSLFTYE